MLSYFWSNTIWYILLLILTIITMAFVLAKSKNRKCIIAFILAALGFLYLIETVIAFLLNAYRYYPKLVENSYQDAALGNIFSQISIASTAALLIVYELPFGWYILFSAGYYLIEELFLFLGIYQHFWYKSVYTLVGFIPLFWFIRLWHDKLVSSSKSIIHYITLFLGTLAVALDTIVLPLRLTMIQIYQIHFFNEWSKNHSLVGIMYMSLLITVLIFVYRMKRHWTWKGIAFALLFTIQYVLSSYGIINFKDGWFFAGTLIDLFGVYLWIVILDRFLRQKPALYGRN